MLNEPELIAYLEHTLSPTERQRVEAGLERDPQLRRQLIQQLQLEAALRSALGEPAANESVKQSVLAVLRGEQEENLKERVMADTTFAPRSRRREEADEPAHASIRLVTSAATKIPALFRRPAFAASFATCLCLIMAAWFMFKPASEKPSLLGQQIEMPVRVELASQSFIPEPGQIVRADATSSATVKFADGTTLHLEPGTEISLLGVDPTRHGGKQLKLRTGSLSAAVARQPEGLPLLIQTPHALVTVVGTEFDLNVITNQTALEVTHGLVKLTGSGETNPVNVAAGEFAVAAPKRAIQYGRLARNPFLWPFSSASVWNRPLGSGAQFAPVPGKGFLADGPLTGSLRPRRPFIGSANDPLRQIFVNGEVRADVRLRDRQLPGAGLADSLVLLQHARRYALEASSVVVRADGDLEAADLERVSLNGPGIMPRALRALPFGLSHLGGLIRAGELENGIRHALSARVSRDRLAGRNFPNPLTVWPAAGNAASGADEEKLCVGTLLAIPPDVDVAKLVGNSGPAYELARAMQDYGVYVSGFIDAPFVLLADDANVPRADEWLRQLVPLLKMVANNSPQAPGGGGTPRRESAPALPGETE